MSSLHHSFNVEDAKKYGAECAVLLFNIRHWLDKNVANKKHFINDRVWTYNSVRAFSEMFPYMSDRQIYSRLKKLQDEGLLITGSFNKNKYDQTTWYSLNEEEYMVVNHLDDRLNETEPFHQTVKSNYANGKMDSCKRSNEITQTVKPIPDINTDINTDINNIVTPIGVDDVPSASDENTWASSIRVAEALLNSICDRDPTHRYVNNPPSLKEWAKHIDLAIRRDGRTEDQFLFLIDSVFVSCDKFSSLWDQWHSNIQSGKKLREKFDVIKNQIIASKNGNTKKPNKGDLHVQALASL